MQLALHWLARRNPLTNGFGTHGLSFPVAFAGPLACLKAQLCTVPPLAASSARLLCRGNAERSLTGSTSFGFAAFQGCRVSEVSFKEAGHPYNFFQASGFNRREWPVVGPDFSRTEPRYAICSSLPPMDAPLAATCTAANVEAMTAAQAGRNGWTSPPGQNGKSPQFFAPVDHGGLQARRNGERR